MKKLTALFVLTVAALCLTALPASADETFDVATLEPLALMGFEVPEWMGQGVGPVPGPDNGPWLNCSYFTSVYGCTYVYYYASGCCVPRDPSPYTYCPKICA